MEKPHQVSLTIDAWVKIEVDAENKDSARRKLKDPMLTLLIVKNGVTIGKVVDCMLTVDVENVEMVPNRNSTYYRSPGNT